MGEYGAEQRTFAGWRFPILPQYWRHGVLTLIAAAPVRAALAASALVALVANEDVAVAVPLRVVLLGTGHPGLLGE